MSDWERFQHAESKCREFYTLLRRLDHEVSELRHCLEGDSPNVQWGLDRVTQIEEAIERTKEKLRNFS